MNNVIKTYKVYFKFDQKVLSVVLSADTKDQAVEKVEGHYGKVRLVDVKELFQEAPNA